MPGVVATRLGTLMFQLVIFWNGPLNSSRMRSNSMPIWYASVQPAMSYGGVGDAPGYGITSGCCCGSNMSMTCGRNAWLALTTNEPAGYCLPATVKGAVARLMSMPTSSSALTNFAAVPKSACDDGM